MATSARGRGPSGVAATVALCAAVVVLAALRWWLLSSPQHFSGWLPSSWFEGEARGMTRVALNTAATWLLTVGGMAALLALLGGRRALVAGFCRPAPGPRRPVWKFALPLALAALVLGLLAGRLLPGVRDAYPLYAPVHAVGPDLVFTGELTTVFLILGTELFYRGLALFALHARMGLWAVCFLAALYALDHIGAPPVELAGSLVTGVLLGHIALRARSVWPGFLIHVSCALATDLAAL